jgi:hypothetical protein
LKEIGEFQQCISLCRIETFPSVEKVRDVGLDERTSSHMVIIRARYRMRMRRTEPFREFNPFLISDDDNDGMKEGRSPTHFEFGRI